MSYLLLWSNKDGNYHYETEDIKQLQSPLLQIYNLRKGKNENKTSKPRIFKGSSQSITAVLKTVEGKEEVSKFEIKDL